MRGDKIIRILQVLKDSMVDTANLLEIFLSAGYGVSTGRMKYLIRAKKQKRQRDKAFFEEFVREKQRFYNLIYYLKSDGIISEAARGGKKYHNISEKGKRKLVALLAAKENAMPLSQYPKTNGDTFTMIVFDVPEKEKKKRDWLRLVLRQLGYKTVQRSVFLGKTKIPQSFLDDLWKLRMADYVEIFEITKAGSLRHLI